MSDEWVNSGAAMFDFAIDGVPFYSAASRENPYVRETAETRRPQFDASAEPGEQSFGPWWLRSQSSFDKGAGVRFFDTARDDTNVITRRFDDSAGVNVWTPGEVSLLNSVRKSKSLARGGRAVAFATGGSEDGGRSGVLLANRQESKLWFLWPDASEEDGMGRTTVDSEEFIGQRINLPENTGGIIDLTVDGLNYYCLTRTGVWKGTIPNDKTTTVPAATKIFARSGAVTGEGKVRGFITFAKERLFVGINRYLYVLGTEPKNPPRTLGKVPGTYGNAADEKEAATAYRQAHHELPAGFTWVDAVEGPGGVYAIANSEESSFVYSVALVPGTIKLGSPTIVAEAPGGERFTVLLSYLGTYLVVGTSKGVRVGIIGVDQSIILGPLTIKSDKQVYALHAAGDYVWAGGAKVNGKYGLYRLNLADPIGSGLLFPWAKDISCSKEYGPETSGADVRSIVQFGNTGRLAFVLRADVPVGVEDHPLADHPGLYIEQDKKRTSGWLRTGRIRFDTTLAKYFHKLRVTTLPGKGTIEAVARFDDSSTLKELGEFTTHPVTGEDDEVTVADRTVEFDLLEHSDSNYQWVQFTFQLSRPGDGDTRTPRLASYQVSAMPSGVRGRMIQVPLMVMDRERGVGGAMVARPVWARVERIESADESGRPVLFQDLVTGESRTCLVERAQFVSTVSPEVHAASRGGVLTVVLRTVDEAGSTSVADSDDIVAVLPSGFGDDEASNDTDEVAEFLDEEPDEDPVEEGGGDE